jgi:hypothetical protein
VNIASNHFPRPTGNNHERLFLSTLFVLIIVSLGDLEGAESPTDRARSKFEPRLGLFFSAKEQQARALAEELGAEVAPEVWDYFEAGIQGDWAKLRKLWRDLSRRSGQYAGGKMDESVRNITWSPLLEAELAYECFTAMDMKFVELFARETIDSIPRGSIYFGGTDPGRGVITAFCKSHADADPFFVLSQNPLADGGYLQYIRTVFGKKIYAPTDADSKQAFEEYKADAAERSRRGHLKPGEQFSEEGGRVSISGQVAVMAINGLLAKMIFDRNPTREFYIEESFALDWMYPHLSPHGLILKLNRKPLAEISNADLQRDRDYWRKQTARFLGGWLTEETPLKAVCEFVERVYLDGDLDAFKGDPLYVTDDRSHSPRPLFGKLRQAQASLYAWRLERATSAPEKAAMKRASEVAFKQTLALCPDSSEYVRRFVVLLKDQKRWDDARLVLETGLNINPGSKRLGELADELEVK